MPEYSKSLGCLDAKHFFQDNSQGTFYTIAPSNSGVDHEMYIDGGAVGTLTIAPSSTAADTTIKVLARVSSSNASLHHVQLSNKLKSSEDFNADTRELHVYANMY